MQIPTLPTSTLENAGIVLNVPLQMTKTVTFSELYKGEYDSWIGFKLIVCN